MPYIGNIVQDFSVNTAMLNTDSVTSIKIDDGTIVNADINDSAAIAMSKLALSITNSEVNASAAIAGTKISPDFGSQNIATTGTLACGDITSSDGNGNLTLKDNNHTGSFCEHLINFTASDDTSLMNIGTPFGSNNLFFKYGSTELVSIGTSGQVDFAGNVDCNAGLDVTGAITGTAGLSIEGETVFNEAGASVDFRVEGDTDTHLLVVDGSSDKVGIGVNPSSQSLAGKFHVKLSTDKHIIFNDGQGEVGNVPCIVPINDSSVVTDLGFRANHLNFAAGTGSQSLAQKMTIDNTGVAIGQGNVDAAAFFHIRCGSDKNIHYSGGIGEIGSVAGFQTVNDAANTLTGFGIRASEMNFAIASDTVLRLHTNGNVGIGTTSPSVPLNVVTTATDAALFESTSGDANGVQLSLRATSASPADDDKLAVLDFSGKDDGNNNTTYAQIRSHSRDVSNGSESGDITFHTRNAGTFDERLRIQHDGNVGIGTTSPSEQLHISSATTTNGLLISSTNNNTRATMELNGKDSSGNQVELRLGGFGDTNRGEIFTVTNHDLGFATNNAGTQFKMKTGGNFQIVDGDLVVASGHGIDFSAGADSASTSNLLDEYEEGEYTPALSNGQAFHSSAYDRLRYTKIGRQVTLTGQLVFQAYNSSNFSNTFTIGLPFNNGNGGDRSEYLFHAGIGYFNPSGTSSPSSGYQPIGFYAAANSSHVSVFAIDPNTDTTTGNWVGAGSDIWVNLTYFTD